MSKLKLTFSIFGLLLLVAGLISGTILVRKNQDIREKAAPASSLSIFPISQNKFPGQSINLSVKLNTGENQVTGIDIQLIFDPSAIQLSQISATSAIVSFRNVIKNEINNSGGTARFAAFTLDKLEAISGDLDILNISGSILNSATSGSYQISFDSITSVSAVDEGQNVLISMVPGTIDVSGGIVPTNSPTFTPTPTNTFTSTTIPTATPTISLNSTLTSEATIPPNLPVSGISFPTIVSFVFGSLLVLGSVLLLIF